MFFFENVRLAFGALMSNKMRSLLTMLGIIIGISSVITITTIGNSLKETLKSSFNILGDNGFYVSYYSEPDENGNYYSNWKDEDYIDKDILSHLKEEFDGKYLVSENCSLGEGIVLNEKKQNISVRVTGVSQGYLRAMSKLFRLKYGRQLNDEDDTQKKCAVMVSDVFVQQYFAKDVNPLGKTINVDVEGVCNADLVIVGIYKYPKLLDRNSVQENGLMGKQTPLLVPYNTCVRLGGQDRRDYSYPSIICRDSNYDVKESKTELQDFFNKEMKAANKKLLVQVNSDEEQLNIIDTVMSFVTLGIAVIAAISLLVGGIGVMNIMLVSITERTREIGIRKAIGAKNSTIKTQFLIEAVIISMIGGIIGIVLGLSGGMLIGLVAQKLIASKPDVADFITMTVSPSPTAIIISLTFSMLVGIFFGSYPASKAAKLNPIDALRYE